MEHEVEVEDESVSGDLAAVDIVADHSLATDGWQPRHAESGPNQRIDSIYKTLSISSWQAPTRYSLPALTPSGAAWARKRSCGPRAGQMPARGR